MTEGEGEDERDIELDTIAAIFPELKRNPNEPYEASLAVEVTLAAPASFRFKSFLDDVVALPSGEEEEESASVITVATYSTHDLSHLPALMLSIYLPNGYPQKEPPVFKLSTRPRWMPSDTVSRLVDAGKAFWEELGHTQVIYSYIDFLKQEAENGFGLADGNLVLNDQMKEELISYDKTSKRSIFEQGTFDCGICLEPKKGSVCYRLHRCGHVFCRQCLQDFYNNAIAEGDVGSVKCLDTDCGKRKGNSGPSKKHLLHPTELLDIPLEREIVQRYVDMKLKKMLESDPNTIYCPRKWCQAPARSKKYAKFQTNDLSTFPEDSDEEEKDETGTEKENEKSSTGEAPPEKSGPPTERLAICSKCALAFCCNCRKGWHGDFFNCRPPADADFLSEEDKASLEFVRLHTSPCPSCNSPTQKTHGCNHMICAKCETHYCYLCSAWLNPEHPYKHFNTRGTDCYYRLFDLQDGDDGNAPIHLFGGARGFEAGAAAEARPPRQDDDDWRGLQHFIEMAANDEEDEWDSDELEDNGLDLFD